MWSPVLCGETHHALYHQCAAFRLAYCKIIDEVYYHAMTWKPNVGWR